MLIYKSHIFLLKIYSFSMILKSLKNNFFKGTFNFKNFWKKQRNIFCFEGTARVFAKKILFIANINICIWMKCYLLKKMGQFKKKNKTILELLFTLKTIKIFKRNWILEINKNIKTRNISHFDWFCWHNYYSFWFFHLKLKKNFEFKWVFFKKEKEFSFLSSHMHILPCLYAIDKHLSSHLSLYLSFQCSIKSLYLNLFLKSF
jgi:hypothetical protein